MSRSTRVWSLQPNEVSAKEADKHAENECGVSGPNVSGLFICHHAIAAQSDSTPKDGELAFPAEYRSYSTFLQGIQKPDAVRNLSINPRGAKTHQGQAFTNGSVLVMEIYNAKKNVEGTVEKGADGNLVKTDLARIFVMQKGAGWEKNAPEHLKNGDWIYSMIKPNGERLDVNYTACRGCHLPLRDAKDYVHRYDEYFDKWMH